MKKPLILIGGGHCMACIDVIERQGLFQIAGIVDTADKIGHCVLNYRVIASDEQLSELASRFDNFLITLGQIKSPDKRIKLFNILENLGVNLPVVISPHALVSDYAAIGKGTIIMHHSLVNAGAVIGSNCIINSKALIEHNVCIGDHCHVSTGAIVNGDAVVGTGCFVGSGSVVREGVRIGTNNIVSAGTRIMRDIESA
jgi:sugar O-acyltransferase (sialic acid O-acetyltransferase NeuD family)